MKGGEVIQLVGLVGSVLSKVIDVIERDRKLKSEARRGLEYIWREMRMVTRELETSDDKNQGAAHDTKILQMKELALDIEDFIDTTWWVPGAYGLFFAAIGMDPRQKTLQEINSFKESIQRVRDWKPNPGVEMSLDVVGSPTWSSPSAASAPCNPEASSIIDSRAEHIRSCLLLPAAEGQPQELRVISIVGPRGVGKTTLARAIYNSYADCCEYEFLALVVASECRNREDFLRIVLMAEHSTYDASSTSTAADGSSISHADDGSSISHVDDTNLRNFLMGKRYLVSIDDLDNVELWQTIKNEFPDNGNNSRIIVTTSVHSIAAECSRGGYVYRMHGLHKAESEEIFWQIVGLENRSPALVSASDGILKKCGGLPLAVISAANYLRQQGRATCSVTGGLTTEQCQRASRRLGDMVANGKVAQFAKINRSLLQCYNGLPDYIHRSCLLYASVFPRGRSINSKVVIRKWIAEGLVVANDILTNEEVANGCLHEFLDRSIVEPVLISNARVSNFRVYSIMFEFIIYKAVSQNFVTLVDEDELLHNKEIASAQGGQSTRGPIFGVRVRRLSVQNSTKEAVQKAVNDINLSAMRSLTICRSHLIDMRCSKLLRVLDLGGCKGVRDTVCADICKLQFLKFLSLRDTDTVNLPLEIRQLKHLETLDVRDTGVNAVPIEVIRLPLLAHLLGRFELPRGITGEMLNGSKLRTLAGVSTHKADNSFGNIMLHARELTKVKIYQTTSDMFNSFPNKRPKRNNPPKDCGIASTNNSILLHLKNRFTGRNPLQILSIDSSDFSNDFLSFLEAPCAITSIKLRGKLDRLPATVTLSQLVGLNKLVLISTGLNSEDLSVLQRLNYLEYLKLVEHCNGFWAGSFNVENGGFQSLKRLCLQAPNLPRVIFQAGSMQSLTILDLLCRDYPCKTQDHNKQGGCLGVEGISNLSCLNQVILHHSVEDTKFRSWNDAVIRHKNKPSVKRQPKPQR